MCPDRNHLIQCVLLWYNLTNSSEAGSLANVGKIIHFQMKEKCIQLSFTLIYKM